MKLNITKEHVDKGIKSNRGLCPTALAFKDLGYGVVSVGATLANAFKNNELFRFRLGRELVDEIEIFDYGGIFHPGEYEITETK